MAKKARKPQTAEADGFWDQPALLNLTADVLIVAGIAALAWAAVTAVQRLPFYPLRELVVTTPLDQVSRAQVEHAARGALAGNFFTLDLDVVQEAFGKLPWVRKAEVRRRWPDAVELALEEHVAVARWRHAEGEPQLVNNYGEVFAAATARPLPLLAGPEGSSAQVLDRYREFEQALAALGRHPAVVALSPREAWQVRLDDGTVLELGRDEAKHPLDERVARFTTHYQAALGKAKLASGGVVDMRYPNGFALRPERKG